MAMKAAIDLEANQSEIIKAGAKKEGKKAVCTPRENAGEWDWKNHAPTANEPKEKVFSKVRRMCIVSFTRTRSGC
jgi:hypothetical protein